VVSGRTGVAFKAADSDGLFADLPCEANALQVTLAVGRRRRVSGRISRV
jgi:hypothetical protein